MKVRAIAVAMLAASFAAAEEPKVEPISGACGVSEHVVTVWANEPVYRYGGGEYPRGTWCAIQMDFKTDEEYAKGLNAKPENDFCFQAYLQRWSDWPGCPGAKLIEVLGMMMPPDLRPKP